MLMKPLNGFIGVARYKLARVGAPLLSSRLAKLVRFLRKLSFWRKG